jgi:hypothetical protein
MSFDISLERSVGVVYVLDGICPFPFFHQGMIVILDYRDGVFN